MSRKNKVNFSKKVLDIAILTAGRVDLFEKCVDAILLQMKPEYQIQVFNNGSPSPEYERVYQKLPQGSQIRRTNQNLGYPGGANSAIRIGSAPLVLFISDDIFIHEGAIETLIQRMNSDEKIAMCGYKFLFPEDSTDSARPAGKVQHIGQATSIRGDIVHPHVGWSSNNPKCNISREVIGVTGASFIVRRELFRKVGGFDLVFGKGYFEDINLCLSLQALGYKIFIETSAVATHGVGQTFAVREEKPDITANQLVFKSRWLKGLKWTGWEM